jgi:hypothetical protein
MNWLAQIPSAAQPQTYQQCSCAAPINTLTTATREERAARAMKQINEDMEHARQTLGSVPSEYHFRV